MIWFADTSALVKRYISEKGSPWMRAEMVRHDVLVSQLTPIEMAAALSKRLREGSISRFVYYQARRRMLTHLAEANYAVLELSQRVVNEALRLTFSQAVRAYDAVQLGTALVAMAGGDRSRHVFVTADEKLEALAIAQGLKTENPSRH
jgi:predicted nucleic acid-binding protein